MGSDVYDVAIVGAGPAGSRLAWRLASAGARVALVDASHPREKPCGGGVTGRALALVADQLAGAPLSAVVVRDARFGQDGARAGVPLRHDGCTAASALLIVSRAHFDGLLRERAIAAGAHPIVARARDVVVDDACSGVILDTGESVRARVVAGADGVNSLVRRRTGRAFGRHDLSIAAGYFVHGVSSLTIDVEFESTPPGYLWSFPRQDHLAVGVCAQADRTRSAHLRAVALRWIGERSLEAANRLQAYSWPIPSLSAEALDRERPAGDRWLLVGDAAGLVDPITREGIYFALRSADLAGDALLGGNPQRAYVERLRHDVIDELRRAAELKAGFFRPRFTRLLVHALASSAHVRDVMADLVAGEQPYRTLVRRLMATLEFRLAWQLAKLRF
jgi:geranylgeranyl reductase family protein